MSRMGRSAGLAGFLAVAREVGLDPYRIAAEFGVPAAALTDPDLRISTGAIMGMIEAAAVRSGAEDLGLRLAARRKLSDLGVVGLAIREQPTLGAALDVLRGYFWLQNESYALDIEVEGDLTFLKVSMGGFPGRHVAEMVIGAFVGAVRTLVGDTWRPLQVCFLHNAPRGTEGHRRLFGVAPAFNETFLGLVIKTKDLDTPLVGADPQLAREVTRYLEQLSAGRTRNFSGQVRDLIGVLLPSGACTVERVADRLGVDRRTVHRRLAAEGASFTALVDEGRVELAQVLLRDPDRTLRRVSELLGFAALSSFAHWFRRHFGCSASAWRAAGGQSPQMVSWRKATA